MVHSSQQQEERTKKRRRGYRAFWLVATVAVGVCGTRFARTVLALFPPSSLRLHRPIKAGILLVLLLVFSTPSPFGHSPYIPLRKHRGRGGLTLLFPLQAFLTPLLVATLLISPIFFAPHTAMLRGTAGEEGEGNPPLIAVRYFVYGVRQGRIVIQRTFFPSQRKSLLH